MIKKLTKSLKSHLAKQSDAGFTLMELMVVVAIVGILTTIAIHGYLTYEIRARQSEAKLRLSSAYAAQTSFYIEAGTFTSCLTSAGFLDGNGKIHYAIGFNDAVAPTASCGPTTLNQACNYLAYDNAGSGIASATCSVGLGSTRFDGIVASQGSSPVTGNVFDNSTIDSDTFTLEAEGNIGGSTSDVWTIDHTKQIVNIQVGI